MPRTARKISSSGIYHVMVRGIDKRVIFDETSDFLRFLYYINKANQCNQFEIYAYCLMPNHAHLLLRSENGIIGNFMSRISVGYVQYFNYKYGRTGHLFQNRFKSEVVEDDSYFLTVFRYIHNNPVKAGFVKNFRDYPWTSYAGYSQFTNDEYREEKTSFLNTSFVLGMFENRDEFEKYLNQKSTTECMNFEEKKRFTDEQIMEKLIKMSRKDLSTLLPVQKQDLFRLIQRETNASTRQLMRVLKMGHR